MSTRLIVDFVDFENPGYDDLGLGVAELLTGVLGGSAELLLDTEDLVVLGQTLRAAWRASLDLAGGQTNNEVGDEGVLSLTGTMRHHRAPAGAFGELVSVDRLGDATDLVDLQQQAVAGLLLDGGLDSVKRTCFF